MTNPFACTTYSAPRRNARAQGALTSGRRFFTNPVPKEKGRFFMHFANSRPDVVRSINQRWLLAYWDRLRDGGELPIWQGLETAKLADLAANLSFHDVVGSDGDARFLIRFHGQRIAEAYGAVCLGRFLDEILPPQYRETALATYRQVLATRLPVYTIADIRDRHGRTVHYERLLLPFSRDGAAVDRILASLETVSPDGAFDNRDILKSNPKAPTFALCTTIRH
jgi:hypothetical protein